MKDKAKVKKFLADNHSAVDIVRFFKELTDSPSAEDVYFQMAFAIQNQSSKLNAVRRDLEDLE